MRDTLKNVGLLALRLLIGYGMARHGWEKISGNPSVFAEGTVAGKLGFPYPLFFAWAAAVSEFAGGILIGLGLFTRVGAFFVLCVMGTAFFFFHAELAFVYGSAALTLVLTGGGKISLDRLIFCRRCVAESSGG